MKIEKLPRDFVYTDRRTLDDFLRSDDLNKELYKVYLRVKDRPYYFKFDAEKYPGSPWLDSLKGFDFKNLRKSRISERREFYLVEHFGYIRFAIEKCSQYIAAQYERENGRQIIEEARLAKAIVQLDKEGNVIKEYGSILEICQAFNIERGDNIRNVLKGK